MAPSEPASGQAEPCLVVMLKSPQRSKRRLAAEIGTLATAAAAHLTDCALEDAAAWRHALCLAPAAASDLPWLDARLGRRGCNVLQSGGNLGERINHVDRKLRQDGFGNLIYIGTDCPRLDPVYLSDAAAALERFDAVLGPARDGGVVLMGARRAWPDLAELPWSTPALHRALDARLRQAGWTTTALATLADVDAAADLVAVRDELAGDMRPARRALLRWLALHRGQLQAGTAMSGA